MVWSDNRVSRYEVILFLLFLVMFVPSLSYSTDISSCQTISSAGYYRLTADISNQNGNCFTIATSNVILDCQGHTIGGDEDGDGYGIYVDAAGHGAINNISIINCSVYGFYYGIYFSGASSALISESTIISVNSSFNTYFGIKSVYVSYSNITNVVANSNYVGISLGRFDHNDIENIIANANTYDGIDIVFASYNNFTNITANSNNRFGVAIEFSTLPNTFTNITANSNTEEGIYFAGSDYNTLTNIIANFNKIGICIQDSNSNFFINSKVTYNSQYGIELVDAGENSNYIYNNIFNNTNNFYFHGTKYKNNWNTTLQLTEDNIVDGIYLGGNYWGKPDGTGFSDTCNDTNLDGICDDAYTLATNNIDYLPLKIIHFPNNPYINISNTQIWNHTGKFYTYEQLQDFTPTLQDYLDNCQADANGNCNVTLDIFSESKGILELYGLSILYSYKERPIRVKVESYSNEDIYVTHLYIIGKDESKMCDLLDGKATRLRRGGIAIIDGKCSLLCQQIYRITLSGPCGISDDIKGRYVSSVCKQ